MNEIKVCEKERILKILDLSILSQRLNKKRAINSSKLIQFTYEQVSEKYEDILIHVAYNHNKILGHQGKSPFLTPGIYPKYHKYAENGL